MAGFADGAVVHEVVVELGFREGAVVVELGEFVDGDAVLLGIGLEDMSDCARILYTCS